MRTSISGGWEAGHEPAVCPCSPESQPHPGLHLKKCGQQVNGSDPAPLLCADEASPGVLRPDVESSGQERHGPVGLIFSFYFTFFFNNKGGEALEEVV